MPLIDGPLHGFSAYRPYYWIPLGAGNIRDEADLAAQIGSNVIRVNISWAEIQPTESGWDPLNRLADITGMIQQARAYRPNLKVVPCVDWIPRWVPGVQGFDPNGGPNAPGHYTNTLAGCEKYGIAVGRILAALGQYADFAELSNEPNIIPSSVSTGIPPDWYGVMSGYAMYWVNQCCGANKHVLMGALDLLSPSPQWMNGYSPTQYLTAAIGGLNVGLTIILPSDPARVSALSNRVRVSCHPYPNLSGANRDNTPTAASNRAWTRYDSVVAVAGGRKMWITEVGWNGPEPDQANFTNYIFAGAILRRPQLEGLLFWPLSDFERQAGDSSSQFYHTGVFRARSDLSTMTSWFEPKPAANRISTDWAYWN